MTDYNSGVPRVWAPEFSLLHILSNTRFQERDRYKLLIESLQQYHYPPDQHEDTQPVKDGNDHAADALRYMIVNHNRRGGVEVRWY